MNTYVVKLVFQVHTGATLSGQFDEQLRLIYADDEEQALLKATHAGHQEEEQLVNTPERKTQWKFIHVTGLYSLNLHEDMVEIYSSITETNEIEQYLQIAHTRALMIKDQVQKSKAIAI